MTEARLREIEENLGSYYGEDDLKYCEELIAGVRNLRLACRIMARTIVTKSPVGQIRPKEEDLAIAVGGADSKVIFSYTWGDFWKDCEEKK